MTPTNEISGIAALLLMALVCRGFAPHLRVRGFDPVTYLMQGIFIGALVIGVRIATYDVVVQGLRFAGVLQSAPTRFYVEVLNTLFNTGWCLAAWRVLVGLHASLPEEDRAQYSWLTAPFYPKRITLFRRRES